jgi:hypothetical protein
MASTKFKTALEPKAMCGKTFFFVTNNRQDTQILKFLSRLQKWLEKFIYEAFCVQLWAVGWTQVRGGQNSKVLASITTTLFN